jgi:LPS-assembly protein
MMGIIRCWARVSQQFQLGDEPRPGLRLRANFRKHPIALAVAALELLAAASIHAQDTSDAQALALKPSFQLQENISSTTRALLPTFVSGDVLTARSELEAVIEGQAMLRRGDTVIRADRLEYDQSDDQAKARGAIRINRAGNLYEGSALELKLDSFEGFLTQPRYRFLKNEAHGEADRVDFLDSSRSVIHNANYTTCQRQPGPNWLPDWILRASSIHIDSEEEVGQAEDAVLSFKGVPILPLPSMSFPLSDKRKSGFMPPTFVPDNINGLEFTLPYYWNIAPNRDATLTPSIMSKRGVDLGAEFRYLESDAKGLVQTNYMPTDTLRNRARWSFATTHSGTIDTGDDDLGGLGFKVNLNRVSDDNYWLDFPRGTRSLTPRLLPTDVTVAWLRDDFSATLRTLKWQTLQDATAIITPPYDRMPQLNARYGRSHVAGFDYSLDLDITQFQGDRALTNQPDALRSSVVAQLSHPWLAPGWFVTPKLQWSSTQYEFNAPLAGFATSASRALPTFSLDSGLILERDTSFFGRGFRQTLEPRAFYVYTPYRDQSSLPIYDTAPLDFNVASIYNENAFSGSDRIADNNLLTLGATTRLLDPANGAEAARFSIAQQLRFADQRVTVPGGAPVTDRSSDLILGATINWNPQWSLDSTVQLNPSTNSSDRTTLSGRYSPSNYRVLSATYSLQRGVSELVDLGWQWPINDLWGDKGQDRGAGRGLGSGRWYSVGHLNYSLKDKKQIDSVFGFEYDAGCWLGRVVLERSQRSGAAANLRSMFQLEFVGFSRLGSSPLQSLKDNIPRYQYLREQTTQPSRFGQYD